MHELVISQKNQIAWLADCIEMLISMHCGIPGHELHDKPIGSRLWNKEIHILWVDLKGMTSKNGHNYGQYLTAPPLTHSNNHFASFYSLILNITIVGENSAYAHA